MGNSIALASTALMLGAFAIGFITAWSLFVPMAFLCLGLSLIVPNAQSLALSHAQNKSNASAMMSFINLGTATIAIFILQSSPTHPVLLLPLLFILFIGGMFFWRGRLSTALA